VEENQKLLLSVVVVLVVLVAIGGGLYLEWNRLSAASADLEAKKQDEATLHQRIDKDIPRLKAELASKTEKVAEYEKSLPSAQEIEAMDETLNNYKVQAGVKLVERRPVQESGGGAAAAKVQQPLYYPYSYRLTLSADFFSWGKFVNLLENHERFIRVDEFDAKPSSKEPGILDITMKISTFSYAKVEQPKVGTETPTAGAAPAGGAQP